jgi:hypothetical protein
LSSPMMCSRSLVLSSARIPWLAFRVVAMW